MSETLYDQIGQTYTSTRHPDPRIATAINAALTDADSIINIGSGAGAYEPVGKNLVGIEPSWEMIRQRTRRALPVVQGVAEALPFRPGAFDVALAVLTLHHWTDWRKGVAEMKEVAGRVVVFAFDVDALANFWLTETYFPEIIELERRRSPSMGEIREELGDCSVDQVPIPHDCVDGFLAAFWRRPEAYLDPSVRTNMSGFGLLNPGMVTRGVARLETVARCAGRRLSTSGNSLNWTTHPTTRAAQQHLQPPAAGANCAAAAEMQALARPSLRTRW
jgi:SAM-dependent methyltransferase